MRMEIKAKFKGADGSLGYRNGMNYFLNFETVRVRLPYSTTVMEKIRVTNLTGGRAATYSTVCDYDSLKAFLNNWQILN